VTRKVYLPAESNWFDFYTGKKYEGGRDVTVDAPLSRIPLFVKEGSILPAGPEIQFASEKSDPVTLYIFPGKNASFTLYEDEGVNYNYESGKFTTIPYLYDEATRTLSIGDRVGAFEGMLNERTFEVVWVEGESGGVSLKAHPHQLIRYNGKKTSTTRKPTN